MRFKSIAIYAVLMLPHAGTLATTLAVADTKDDATKEEMKRLEGTLTVTSTKVKNFESLPGGAVISTITIKGDKWVCKYKEGTSEGTFTIDPTTKPKSIDMVGGEEKESHPGMGREPFRIFPP